jgi:hypothetical protein
MGRALVHMGRSDVYKILLESLKRRDNLEDLGRWEDNIKMNIMEIWWDGVNWIHLAQDRDQR